MVSIEIKFDEKNAKKVIESLEKMKRSREKEIDKLIEKLENENN